MSAAPVLTAPAMGQLRRSLEYSSQPSDNATAHDDQLKVLPIGAVRLVHMLGPEAGASAALESWPERVMATFFVRFLVRRVLYGR